ncbi:MAG: nucleotidyltransferase [archaeon]
MIRARETYESVRAALKPLRALGSTEVYLQGSYGNNTNILADGNVDIVAQLNVPSPDPLLFSSFRKRVLSALQAYYSISTVTEGNFSLRVRDPKNRLPVDILVGLKCVDGQGFEGLWFSSANGTQITDYPKLHIENGERKDQESGGRYKETVRAFKRVRAHLSENGLIEKGGVPSPFLESLLYNVPTGLFSKSRQETFCNSVGWLLGAPFEEFKCQNGRRELFGSSPRQWSVEPARKFLAAVEDLWNRW